MIRSSEDLYAYVRELADEYRRTGLPAEAEAEALMNTLSISSVPGEVLGEIRAELRRLPPSGPGDAGRRLDALAAPDRALDRH